MSWRDQLLPATMQRVVIAAPASRLRRVLIEVADAGVFEPEGKVHHGTDDGPAARLLAGVEEPDKLHPELKATDDEPPDLASLEPALLAGEASLEHQTDAALRTESCAALAGWISSAQQVALSARIAPLGGALVQLSRPRGVMPPTASSATGIGQKLRPLVTTYATVPYRDVDPTFFAAFTYIVMFGMMFGDVAHGAALVAIGIAAHFTKQKRFEAAQRLALFLIGAGIAAVFFGFLYGEAFGPTGLVPTLWLRPLDEPETLLMAGLVIGSVLLAITFVFGSINRWREAGWSSAMYDGAGIGGALLFSGAAATTTSIVIDTLAWLQPVGIGLAVLGAVLVFIGLIASAGFSPEGVLQAMIEMFDTVLRLGSNVVSFTRLAAFGLTHAVITEVVWDGTVALWNRSGLIALFAAALLFVIGNIAAFTLSGLVGAIQALRLEYYELFSRIFASEGRPFQPWHVPTRSSGSAPPTALLDSSAQPLETS